MTTNRFQRTELLFNLYLAANLIGTALASSWILGTLLNVGGLLGALATWLLWAFLHVLGLLCGFLYFTSRFWQESSQFAQEKAVELEEEKGYDRAVSAYILSSMEDTMRDMDYVEMNDEVCD